MALAVVVLAAGYLVALGAAALLAPRRAARFLLGFAATPARHYAELAARLGVGAALVVQAPRLPFTDAFALVGWVVLATTAGLLLVPWRWHRRFTHVPLPLPPDREDGPAKLMQHIGRKYVQRFNKRRTRTGGCASRAGRRRPSRRRGSPPSS